MVTSNSFIPQYYVTDNHPAIISRELFHLVQVELSSKSSASADYFDAKFEEISDEIKALQDRLGEHNQQIRTSQNTHARISELLHLLDTTDFSVKEYRDDVVRSFINRVVVLSAERIQVTFKGNTEIKVQLPCE